MSSEVFIVYFGLRFEVHPHEIEALELRSDSRMVTAKKVGLKSYWGNFGGVEEHYLLFVGSELAVIGAEGSAEVGISYDDLQNLIGNVTEKLREAGFTERPALHLRWQPDI